MHSLKYSALGLPSPKITLHAFSQHQELLKPDNLEAIGDMADHRFFDGSGSSGKTYFYNTLIEYLKQRGKIILPFATIGIALDTQWIYSSCPCTLHVNFPHSILQATILII